MKNLTGLLLLVVALMLLPGCAITHKFGPYTGKVVDKETGEPIEGAVVFMQFYTGTIWNPGGRNLNYTDAVEYLTDTKGEFNIPAQRIFVFHPGDTWDDDPSVIIFKPGYGTFPRHRGTVKKQASKGWFPINEAIRIELPSLKTRAERVENLGNAWYFMDEIPCAKQSMILKFKNMESISLGFQPETPSTCGGKK